MPTTTQPPSVVGLTELQTFEPGRLVGSFRYETLAVWRGTPNLPLGAWHVSVDCDMDVEPFSGTGIAGQGIARLRLSTGATSTPAVVNTATRRLVIGWMPVPDAQFTVRLEAKRSNGGEPESFAFYRADPALVWAPNAGSIGGPNYPPGITPPSPVLFWGLGPFVPVGVIWTEVNLETETLSLVGAPVVDPVNGISLTAGTQIIGAPLPEPNDTFDVTLDVTTPAVTVAGHRIFATKTGTSNAAPGVSLRYNDTTGGLILRYVDAAANNVVSTLIPNAAGQRALLRIVKTAATVDLYRNGVLVGSITRTVPLASAVGGAFSINGFTGNPAAFTGDLTVHSISIADGN